MTIAARTTETPEAYATRRARETRKLYAVWSVEGSDLKWAALWCISNQRTYQECGATRADIYDERGWRTGRRV